MQDRERTEWQPLDLGGGTTAYLEVTSRGRQEVGVLDRIPFDQVVQTLTRIAQGLETAVDAVKPSKASIEIGVEFGLEAGQVVALIARGTGKANLKVALEWDQR
ncbi:MAG: CU044_2847 family protein [Arenicellales bacterium]